jgi:hypothetical protein
MSSFACDILNKWTRGNQNPVLPSSGPGPSATVSFPSIVLSGLIKPGELLCTFFLPFRPRSIHANWCTRLYGYPAEQLADGVVDGCGMSDPETL